MIITKSNYNEAMNRLNGENIKLSEQFLEMFRNLDIKNFNILSVGNSISAGYSKCDEILPFLMRSNIYSLDKDKGYYSYARIRRNEDSNIYRWYNSNISHEEIIKLNINDIEAKKDTYVEKFWSRQTLENYDNLAKKSNIGFKDLNLLDNNIIIYNGFTGQFTNSFRNDTSLNKIKIIDQFKKDIYGARMILNQIYLDNPNTQVYVCGLPNIMKTGIISSLDTYIKKICDDIPNTIYVPGIVRNALFYLDGQKQFDIHYSRPEYLQLWNNITNAINNNYIYISFMTTLIEKLKKYSDLLEKSNINEKENNDEISNILVAEFEKFRPIFYDFNLDFEKIVTKIVKHYSTNYLSTFSYTPKEKTISKIYSFVNINGNTKR